MRSYWINFARNGDPNGAGLPAWPTFNPDLPTVQLLDPEAVSGELPERQLFDLIDACMQRVRTRAAAST
jgi:para-nitrobenzyl esterase